MLTMTSRQVQTHYGEFIEASRDQVVCVTRHSRPVFYAIPAKLVDTNASELFEVLQSLPRSEAKANMSDEEAG